MKGTIKAYKVFNPDWTSKHGDTVFEVGKSYHQNGKIECCKNGYHACTNLSDCFSYYDFNCRNKVAEVNLSGTIDKEENNTKICASDIKIVREIPWAEILKQCNVGNSNTGISNTGNGNVGDCNVGDRNVGGRNVGDRNVGGRNTGDCNVGDWNVGYCNVGGRNVGYRNVGNGNVGDCNTGNGNVGDWNVGDRNVGGRNVGDRNVGDCNVGDWNTGNWNTGDWNTGFFNTTEPNVFMFNKDTGMKRNKIKFPNFLYFNLTVWVSCDTATEEEMKNHKQDIETCGGFLKTLEYKEAFRLAWDKASKKEHKQVLELPNFDADIFCEISGIDVRKEKI